MHVDCFLTLTHKHRVSLTHFFLLVVLQIANGAIVGDDVAPLIGDFVGRLDGDLDGATDGFFDGETEGFLVGDSVGSFVGV